MARASVEHMYYGPEVKGDKGNFDQPVRFDWTSGYIGISQFEGKAVKERVLLSPVQARALMEFIRRKGRTSDG